MAKFIKAVEDKVMVEIIEEKNEKSDGGIILPESSKLDPQSYGKVLSKGEQVNSVSEGDIVTFNERAGMDLTLNRKKLKCIKSEEIYGIMVD